MTHGAFPAFIVEERDGRIAGQVGTLTLDRLPAGEVTIEIEYSSLNYKDALASTGQGKIVRAYPHVPGIDAAGTVVDSHTQAFAGGERVLVTGYELGAGSFGGYAKYVRVPAAWVVRTPDQLTNLEAMALGTAGFTAALSLLAMERNGATPARGPILVTGATGGVGSLAVDMLAGQGYTVAASTGKADQHALLRELGAGEILGRDEVRLADERPRPLLAARWAGAVDTVGGSTLGYLIRATCTGGAIAVCGLVGGSEFAGTVMPFLLRGIRVLGIDSAATPMPYREIVWRRLAGDLKPRHLDRIARVIPLAALPEAIADILQGRVTGRLVVSVP